MPLVGCFVGAIYVSLLWPDLERGVLVIRTEDHPDKVVAIVLHAYEACPRVCDIFILGFRTLISTSLLTALSKNCLYIQ